MQRSDVIVLLPKLGFVPFGHLLGHVQAIFGWCSPWSRGEAFMVQTDRSIALALSSSPKQTRPGAILLVATVVIVSS